MVIRLGVLGFSEGNGHPFSFSAIVNGYDDEAMGRAGWPVIHGYLRQRDVTELARLDARVTCAWTPDPALTARLCAAARVEHAVAEPEQMQGKVDAVMILRDDADSHLPLALPFLRVGVPVFVDKPLTRSLPELRTFTPHLEAGRLMSCAALRFARELDEPRADLASWGPITLARGAVVLDWERYGIHMVEAILGVLRRRPVEVVPVKSLHPAQLAVRLDDDTVVEISCLGAVPKTFRVDFFGCDRATTHDLVDNFTAFQRTIARFVNMVRTGTPAIPVDDTLDVIRTILAGRAALDLGRAVRLADLDALLGAQ